MGDWDGNHDRAAMRAAARTLEHPKRSYPVYGLHVNGRVVFQASFATLERACAGARWRVRSPFWIGATIGRPGKNSATPRMLTENVPPPTLTEPTKETDMHTKPWPTKAEHERRQRADHRADKLDARIAASREDES